MGNWGHIIFPSLSILFPWYVPTIKKSFTLTIIKAQEKIAQNTNNLSNLFHGQAQAEYYLVGPDIILMALAIYILLIHYFLPLNHDFTELVFSYTSSASDIVSKMNHIPTLSSAEKCPKLN